MAGMEGLGRLFNTIPIAASKPMKFRGASAVSFIVTGNDTFTLSVASSFGGSYTQPSGFAPIRNVYWSTATDGTAAWQLTTLSPSVYTFKIGSGGTTGLTTAAAAVVTVFTSEMQDPYDYIQCVPTGSGLVTAVLHDLVVQRKPANLEILGA